MRSVTRILFSLRRWSGCFESDGGQEFIQIIDDPLVEAVELRALVAGQVRVAGEGAQQACCKRCVDSLE